MTIAITQKGGSELPYLRRGVFFANLTAHGDDDKDGVIETWAFLATIDRKLDHEFSDIVEGFSLLLTPHTLPYAKMLCKAADTKTIDRLEANFKSRK